MLTIKHIVVKNLRRITLIMVAVILFLAAWIQLLGIQQTGRKNAQQIFTQVEQILDENSKELVQVRSEYEAKCLSNARMVAYILEDSPQAWTDVDELRKIAANMDVDEIHIFNYHGVIVSGTHPEYYGYCFDSGEQMNFFKPLLKDKSLELVQDITPNTAAGKLVQYSALWSEDGEFILQIGMYPANVLRATEKNELSYIFSLLRAGVGYGLYAIDPEQEQVVGATVVSDVGKTLDEIGLRPEQLEAEGAFHARVDGQLSYCLSRQIGENRVLWAASAAGLYRPLISNSLLLLAGLLLISLFLVFRVSNTMDRTVADPIKQVNQNLRAIQDGDLTTQVGVRDSREFSELSEHINSMVSSLLRSSEKLELSEKIKSQKEELERQHDQLEAAVERAEAASRAKSEFLFNMSHDIRTPMNAILGFTNLALESSDPDSQREYLERIDLSSKQLLDIIDNILELSKIENRKAIVEEDFVDVKQTLHKLCTILDSDLKQKNLTCQITMDLQHTHMYLDTTHYSQIFLNLASNAIKYTPDGGVITVSFRELPGQAPDTCAVETVIEDTGIGMSSEFLAQAFESFTRERTSTASGLQGTGLGLAIVKNLVELMSGTIHIASRQGEGTRVTVRLPHRLGAPPAAEQPEEAAPDSTFLEGRYILLAEDIDINAMIATKLLSSRGCMVDRARDGVECVDMLLKAEAGYYDLVLMDIQMPNMDGYAAARAIRAFEDQRKAAIPILAMTANAFKEDCDKAAEAGMDGHIAKPLDTAKMFQTIAQALRSR